MVFDNTYDIGDILTFVAISVALFGPYIWRTVANIVRKKQIIPIIRIILMMFEI